VARASYVHPAVLDLAGGASAPRVPDGPSGLRRGERALLALIG
jgi:hypothetical protein